MNPNQPSREQIEARITALLLGELPADEAQLLRWTIAQDAALQKLQQELASTIVLVREAEKNPAPASGENIPLKLSDERRKKLLAHFQTPRPQAAKELFWLKRIEIRPLVPALVVLGIVALLAAISIPNFVKARATSQSNAIINNLRQIDAAKNQWALENKKPADAVVTMDDLKPYLKNGGPQAVAGEKYIVGKVSEEVVADIDAKKAKQIGVLASRLASGGANGQAVQLSSGGTVTVLTESDRNRQFAENNKARLGLDLQGGTPFSPVVSPPAAAAMPPAEIVLPKPDSTPEVAQNEALVASAAPTIAESPAPAAPQALALATSALSAGGVIEDNLATPPHALDSSGNNRHGQNINFQQGAAATVTYNGLVGAGSSGGGSGGGGGAINNQAGTSAISPTAGLPMGTVSGAIGNGFAPSDASQSQQLAKRRKELAGDGYESNGDVAAAQNPAVAGKNYYRFTDDGSDANKTPVMGDRPASGNLFVNGELAINAPAAATAPVPAGTSAQADFGSFDGSIRSPDVFSEAAKELPKSGSGVLALTGNNNYSGATTVSGGTLLADDFEAAGTSRVASDQSHGFNLDVVKLKAAKQESGDQVGQPQPAAEVAQNSVSFQRRLQNIMSHAAGSGGSVEADKDQLAADSIGGELNLGLKQANVVLAPAAVQTSDAIAMNGGAVNSPASGFTSSLTTEQLQAFHGEMIERERAYKDKAVELEQLKSLDKTKLRDVLPNVVNDGTLNDLLAKLHECQRRIATLKSDSTTDNVNVTRVQSLVDTLNHQIDDRTTGILFSLESQVASKKSSLDTLTQAVDEARQNDILESAKNQPYYDAKRKLEELRDLHKLLYAKIEAEKLDAEIPKTSIVQITDLAEPATSQTLWQKITGETESKTRIKVENDVNDSPGGYSPTPSMASYDPYFVQTTFEIIQSDAVLGKAVDALKLDETWANNNGGEKLEKKEAIALLRKRLDLKPVRNSKLVEIGATSTNPEEAAKIANAVAEAYRDYRLDSRRQTTQKGIEVLGKQYDAEGKVILAAQAQVERLAPKAVSESADQPLPKPAPNAPIPQPEILARENNFSTFSLNVSDVSFKLAAASLENGRMPDAASIRSEEFINAFDYRDPEAAAGQPVAFTSERARYPFAQNRDLLRFSVKTAAAGRAADRPLNLVLLLDKSGSMERADRLAIIREAMRVLAAQLHPQDTVSVVTFARTARLWADGVAGDKAGETLSQVGGITPEGGTNLEEAMRLAYETARRHYLANGINRVVLLTDGAANLGNVDAAVLKQKVEAQRKQGIALDCFGIGWEDFNDDMLAELSGNGDGRYAFINTPEEAGMEFAAKLAGALQVAAQDVKMQVEFNPQRVISWRQIGYAKHQLTKEQFRDNSVLAAEIAAQEAGNALYTVETKPDGIGPVATVHVRYKIPGTEEIQEHEWEVPYTGNAVALEQSSAAMRLAATAGAFSEWLAGSPFAQEVSPDELLKTMSGVPEIYGADQRPKKLEWMIRQAKSLSGK